MIPHFLDFDTIDSKELIGGKIVGLYHPDPSEDFGADIYLYVKLPNHSLFGTQVLLRIKNSQAWEIY